MGSYTRKFGNEESGFLVVHEDATCSVRVRTWGFWQLDLAATFTQAVVDGCLAAASPVNLLIDALELRPQREEGQKAIGAMMISVRKLNLASMAFIVSSTITKMQLVRIAREHAVPGWAYFPTEQLAVVALKRGTTSKDTG